MAVVIEGLAVTGVTEILKKLIPNITEHIGLASSANEELEKLKNTLEMIKAVVTDAERRQTTDEAVKLWLRKLKNVAYDVDDILDAYLYKCMQKHELMKHKRDQVLYYASPSTNPVLSCFKLGNKIKDINLKFDEIALEKNQLGLQPYVGPLGRASDVIGESINRKTYAFLGDPENIVGRHTDKHNILKMLLTIDQVEKVTVIPIVGMGGSGKTTLAQLVYHDESVEKHFDLKIWVCISIDFNIKRLLKDVIESITRTKCDDLSNIDVLVQELHHELGGKKYLLVLDDMWNRNADEWANLKELLSVGALGSKIIITTRIDDVAKIVVGKNPIYNLEVLKEDECRSIFKKLAFGTGGPVEIPILSDIANQLVKKCGGLPLAAKTLGSLMHSKKDQRDWVFMRDNEILNIPEDQNKIFGILKLSYDHLPSYLKQCFLYCAIFPKDYIIERKTLIQLWMAEGFIPPLKRNDKFDKLAMEDIGNDYFFRLLGNSLLREIEVDTFGDVSACKMHDLVHDLAQAVSGPHECLTVEASKIGDITEVRRLHLLNLDKESIARVSNALKKAKKLRTLIVSSNNTSIITNLIKKIFQNNTLLRVLDLSRTSFVELPFGISSLKHLRYLGLSTWIRVANKLHDSISTLYHLQTLKIGKHEFPRDAHLLINLRGNRMMDRCSRGNRKMELCSRGNRKMERGNRKMELCSRGSPLRKYSPRGATVISLGKHSFGGAKLPTRIFRPGGAKLPTRMMGLLSCFLNLVVLKLWWCQGVEQLPSLGELLPLLRILYIKRMDGVTSLGKFFHGTTAAVFPSLKEFTLEEMINLEEWVVEEEEQQQQFLSTTSTLFPHLEKLVISNCPRLKVVPIRVFPSLTEMSIDGIKGGGMTVSSLKSLELYYCPVLKFLPDLCYFTSLRKLIIQDCKELVKSLPDEDELKKCLPSLEELRVKKSKKRAEVYSLEEEREMAHRYKRRKC